MFGLFRFVFFLFALYVVYLFYRIYRAMRRVRKSQQSPQQQGRQQIQGVMVKDEVCNTYIARDDAIREVRDGREYFFCSEECRRKFRER